MHLSYTNGELIQIKLRSLFEVRKRSLDSCSLTRSSYFGTLGNKHILFSVDDGCKCLHIFSINF